MSQAMPPMSNPPMPGAPMPYGAMPAQKTSASAVASLIFGILGCIPFVSILAVILSIVGISKTGPGPNGLRGRGMAVAGLILGLIGLIWTVTVSLGGAGVFALFKATAPQRELAKAFVTDVSKGDFAAARAKCTADVDQDLLKRTIEDAKGWGAIKDVTLVGVNMKAATGTQSTTEVQGVIEFDKVRRGFSATVVKEGETPKLKHFAFEPN